MFRQDDLPPDTTEASFYGLENLTSIEELVRGNRSDSNGFGGKIHSLNRLRVMHCVELTTLKGVGLFKQLQDLNVSSNNILNMAGIETL